MAKSDALFQLIQAMSPEEKRYFKRMGHSPGSVVGKNYLELFDLLQAMKTYDEPVVVRQLSNRTFAKNLSAGKNYLYRSLLKSLRHYAAGTALKTAQIQLAEWWIDIQILLDKGLFQQAFKLIARAKKIGQQFHLHLDLLKLNSLERELRNAFERKNTLQTMERLQAEGEALKQQALLDLDSFTAYETVYIHIKNKDENKRIRQAIHTGLERFKKAEAKAAQHSFWTQVQHQHLLAHQCEYQSDYKGYIQHLGQILSLFDQQEKLKNEYQERYLNTLNNYFNGCLQAQELERLPQLLEQLRRVKPRHLRYQAKIEQHSLYYQLLYHLIKKQYDQVIALAPQIEQCLRQYDRFLSINRKLTFLYNVGVAYFLEATAQLEHREQAQGLLHTALDWLNAIENEAKFETRKDVKKFTKTLTAVIYFELEEDTLAESKINIGIRYLKKTRSFSSGEGLLLKHLQKVLYEVDKGERKKLFAALYEGLAPFPAMEELRQWVAKKY